MLVLTTAVAQALWRGTHDQALKLISGLFFTPLMYRVSFKEKRDTSSTSGKY